MSLCSTEILRRSGFQPRSPKSGDPSTSLRAGPGAPWLLVFGQRQGLAFGDVITIPLGNFDDVVAGLGDHGLAAETRIELLIGGHVETVEFVVVRRADSVLVLDPQMAGGTGADAAAGVVEEDAEVLCH